MASNNRERGGRQRTREGPHEESEKINHIREQQNDQQAVRQGYQELTAKLKAHQDNDDLAIGNLVFEEILEEANEMCRKASRPREQLQDANVLEKLTRHVHEDLCKLQQHAGRTPEDFIAGLKRKYGMHGQARVGGDGDDDEGGASAEGNTFDWTRMGREDGVHFVRLDCGFGTMLGPLSAEAPKGRAVPQRRQRGEGPGATVTPDDVDADAADDNLQRERETQTRARDLHRMMKKTKSGTGRVPILPLCIDKDSFSKSVENLFALSFLIKEGLCQLHPVPVPADGNPMEGFLAEAKAKPTDSERAAGNVENEQFIIRFDYGDWRKLKEKLPSSGPR